MLTPPAAVTVARVGVDVDRPGRQLVVEADRQAAAVLGAVAVAAPEPAGDRASRRAGCGRARRGPVRSLERRRTIVPADAGVRPHPVNSCARPSRQYGHSGTSSARAGRSTLPPPSVSSTLSATLRANQPSWASWAAALRTRPPSPAPARSARYCGQRAGPADVAEAPPEHQLAHDRRRDADRREGVVDQQRAAVGDAPSPVADVGPRRPRSGGRRRCTARRSRRATCAVGVGRGRPTWRTRWRTPAATRLRSKATPVGGRLGGVPVDLAADRDRCRRAGRWRRSPRPRARGRRGRSSTGRGSCRSRRSRRPAGTPPRRRRASRPAPRSATPRRRADGRRRSSQVHAEPERHDPRHARAAAARGRLAKTSSGAPPWPCSTSSR